MAVSLLGNVALLSCTLQQSALGLVDTVPRFTAPPAARLPSNPVPRAIALGMRWRRQETIEQSPAPAPPVLVPAADTSAAQLREVESLSVIASSVLALGVLPGEELKVMLTGICEAIPPEALKSLLEAVGNSLAPHQHKAILVYVGPAWVEATLGKDKVKWNQTTKEPWWHHYDEFGRDTSRWALNGLLPRRAAKAALNKWIRDTDAAELKRVVQLGVRRVGPARLAALAPTVLGAIVGAPAANTLANGAINAAETPPRRNSTMSLATLFQSRLDPATAAYLAPRLLLALDPPTRRRAVAEGIRSLSDRRARALLATPALVAVVAEDKELARQREILLAATNATLMSSSVDSLNDTEIRGSTTSPSNFVLYPLRRKLAKSWLATPQPMSPQGGQVAPKQRNSLEVRSQVADAVQQLPPALIAAQLRSLIESLPAKFVCDEAVSLVQSLPSAELVEAAVSLVDAAPETALRGLAAKLLDVAADRKGSGPNSATALHSLARAAEQCDVKILRSTARALLRGVEPKRVADEAARLLSKDEAPSRVKRAILNALVAAEDKSRRFSNLREMLDDAAARTTAPAAPAAPKQPGATKTFLDNIRRMLLEKRPPSEADDDGISYSLTPPGLRRRNSLPIESVDTVPLEGLLLATLKELSPELVLEKALETLAALPPEAYEPLAKIVVNALWDRLVLSALPTGVTSSVRDLVESLTDRPRDATLAVSYVASATGGVAGGAAAKGALSASAKLGATAKGALLSTSAQTTASAALGMKLTAAASSVLSAKTVAIASVAAYAARLLFTGDTDEPPAETEWASVAGEAALAASLLAVSAIGVAVIEEVAAAKTAMIDTTSPKDRLTTTLLAASDERLRRVLVALARYPPRREAAAACRDALLNAAREADLGEFVVVDDGDDDYSANSKAFLDKAKRNAKAAANLLRQTQPKQTAAQQLTSLLNATTLLAPAPDSTTPVASPASSSDPRDSLKQ